MGLCPSCDAKTSSIFRDEITLYIGKFVFIIIITIIIIIIIISFMQGIYTYIPVTNYVPG